MPHVTFGETYPTRRSYDENRALTRVPEKGRHDDIAIVRRRSRTISYKIPEEKPKQPEKCADDKSKTCIERKTTYKDGQGNIIKIIYEDSCGNITKTIYPTPILPPAPEPPRCRSPSPKPPPPVSEPSNISSEDVQNCNWTKIVVKNSRGVIWKIVHVDCYGKTMKTEYPKQPEEPRRRSSETRRYVVKEFDQSPPRRRYSETKKVVVEKELTGSNDSKVSGKESEVHSSSQKTSSDTTTASKRDSGVGSSRRNSGESGSEVLKDADGVTRRVTRTYVDSRGRRRTVVYDD